MFSLLAWGKVLCRMSKCFILSLSRFLYPLLSLSFARLSAWLRSPGTRAPSPSPWRRPRSRPERRRRTLPYSRTWRRWRTTSPRPSASPTCLAALPSIWSSRSSHTSSARDPAGEGEVLMLFLFVSVCLCVCVAVVIFLQPIDVIEYQICAGCTPVAFCPPRLRGHMPTQASLKQSPWSLRVRQIKVIASDSDPKSAQNLCLLNGPCARAKTVIAANHVGCYGISHVFCTPCSCLSLILHLTGGTRNKNSMSPYKNKASLKTSQHYPYIFVICHLSQEHTHTHK